jgi:hypothetical protein
VDAFATVEVTWLAVDGVETADPEPDREESNTGARASDR